MYFETYRQQRWMFLPLGNDANMMTFALAKTTNEDLLSLANKLGLDLVELNDDSHDFLLVKKNSRFELKSTRNKALKPFFIDFSKGKYFYRLRHSNLKNELIAKACGLKGKQQFKVLDATAGLGRDGLLLAKLGADVCMLEKNSIVHTLLEDALARFFAGHPEYKDTIKIELKNEDANKYIKQMALKADVIYLDPMFPTREKSAKIKKDMQVLQQIITQDTDYLDLFNLALKQALKRVVVKRPLHSKSLSLKKPDIVYKGKAMRFDVYLNQSIALKS